MSPAVFCIALMLAREVPGNPEGRVWTMWTAVNRSHSDIFPKDVCAVIYQLNPVPQYAVIQPPIVIGGILEEMIAWTNAHYNPRGVDPTGGAMCFHSTRRKTPKGWSGYLGTVGNQKYFRKCWK